MTRDAAFQRLELLVGSAAVEALAGTRVLLFGVGGVGSWCAEALIRGGVGHLHMVDADAVDATNINRQLPATRSTIGRPKVEVMRERLLDINPRATVVADDRLYDHGTKLAFDLERYDFVLDAIDSLASKVELIDRVLRTNARLFSSMGAARKTDAAAVRVGSFWQTRGCPLARFVRKRLRHRRVTRDFTCVYSPESPTGQSRAEPQEGRREEDRNAGAAEVGPINGSAAHVTGVFGFQLAGLVINRVVADATVSLTRARGVER